jgi:TonB-linked SusC/RagA family outer membrane protein
MKKYILSLILCLSTVAAAYADALVKGVVYEPSGETAIAATVYEKGNPTGGVSTDIDGAFTLKVSSLNATLVVSYIGMETQEVALKGRDKVDITLKDSGGVNLDEVVVVGYGVQKKINATGSVKTIDNAVLESRPVANAVQGLQGAVAGLNITNDAGGALGESMNINIRGVGSIGEGSSSSPLILIDGMEGDLSTINPNDIANISVLKDAAAASIYGSRAPFGVILVTTKSGQKGTSVTYSGNVRIATPISVPKMLDSYTFALMVNESYANSGATNIPFSQSNLAKIKQYQMGLLSAGTEQKEDGTDEWKGNLVAWGNTDWYDVYLKNHTTSQEHNLSVSGGGDKVTYYLSGNFLDQNGLFNYADENYQRLALTGKTNIKFNKYVSLNWTTRIVSTDNDKPSALNSLFYHNIGRRYPTIPLTVPNGEYHEQSMVQALSQGGRISSKTQQFYNQANLLIEPIKDWQIHADISSRIEHNPYTRQFNPIYSTGPNGTVKYLQVLEGLNANKKVNTSTGSFTVIPAAGESYYEKANATVNYFSTNFYTDYSFKINENHNFKALVGVQTEYYHTETTRVASSNILLSNTPFLPSEIGGESTLISEKKGEWSSVGIFGRINYNYADRYMAEANLRGDAASRFPSNQRWGTFPSFSIGWNIAQEDFWENIRYKGFEYLKLRASYGTLGNQNTTSYYPYYQQMASNAGQLVLGGTQASVLPVYDPYSSSLTWEKIENVGAGIDWGFFSNRLTGAFDWYQRTTKDMVGPAMSLPGVYGADAPKTNNAELRTRGWEFEISWRDRIGKDFSYGISASLSDYKTVITKYDSPDNKISGWYQGKTYGDIWGYKVVGIAQSDAEMAEYLAQHSQSAIGDRWGGGDIMYMDIDNNGEVSPGAGTLDNHGDKVIIGNSTPRYAYSFTLEGAWKWIDFRAYFQGIGKRDFFVGDSDGIGSATFFGWGGKQWQFSLFEQHLDYYRFADSELGANTDAYYGRIRYDQNNIQASDRFIQNAAYLRLKNLQIGFSLPQNTKLARYVKKARLYFSGENLFTITKLKIFDPEALQTSDDTYDGGAGKTYPQYRTYSIGLELTF